MNTALAVSLNVVDGKIVTTSTDISKNFGKEHFNVVRDIENLDCSGEFRSLNFEATSEIKHLGATTREVRYYNITKDGLAFLVMGYRGKRAAEFKEKYIAAFNMMEKELLSSISRL